MNHGHVTPNEDGSKARCGGPGLCHVCSTEQAAIDNGKPKAHYKIKYLLRHTRTPEDQHAANQYDFCFDMQILTDEGFDGLHKMYDRVKKETDDLEEERLKSLSKVDKIIEGLQLLRSYGEVSTAAEHDTFYAGLIGDNNLTPDDAEKMDKLGWSYDDDSGWRIFT